MGDKKKTFFRIGRCAINGRYVSVEYAKKHPKTTIVEKVKRVAKEKSQ